MTVERPVANAISGGYQGTRGRAPGAAGARRERHCARRPLRIRSAGRGRATRRGRRGVDCGDPRTPSPRRSTVPTTCFDGGGNRAQKRLDDDPDRRSGRRPKALPLAGRGPAASRSHPARRSGEFLHGLELLTDHDCLPARDKARRPKHLDESSVMIRRRPRSWTWMTRSIPPIDEFLSGEIAVRLGRRTTRSWRASGGSVLSIDLLRLRGRQSRDRALGLEDGVLDARTVARLTGTADPVPTRGLRGGLEVGHG